ncbi:unnamed protein product [Phytophthora fragariaefolia]|uniref:Unnamed protein product n=1 Tax=Phytophthora fragariaefolia TaxID=1490495 RepID=A0A9W6XR12_9STRA|nr:unnamed protein product [Phytophthora fragariaefolia]
MNSFHTEYVSVMIVSWSWLVTRFDAAQRKVRNTVYVKDVQLIGTQLYTTRSSTGSIPAPSSQKCTIVLMDEVVSSHHLTHYNNAGVHDDVDAVAVEGYGTEA